MDRCPQSCPRGDAPIPPWRPHFSMANPQELGILPSSSWRGGTKAESQNPWKSPPRTLWLPQGQSWNPRIPEAGKALQGHRVQAVPDAHRVPSPEPPVPRPGIPWAPTHAHDCQRGSGHPWMCPRAGEPGALALAFHRPRRSWISGSGSVLTWLEAADPEFPDPPPASLLPPAPPANTALWEYLLPLLLGLVVFFYFAFALLQLKNAGTNFASCIYFPQVPECPSCSSNYLQPRELLSCLIKGNNSNKAASGSLGCSSVRGTGASRGWTGATGPGDPLQGQALGDPTWIMGKDPGVPVPEHRSFPPQV
ncbi:uncharacterized protein LOC121674049 [Corvus kubaryi]|uniref:uncharacterized protein LOC121674049 n=1 Tax=Corvus kubaryi TaxID=68294 RepID=UPI001C054F6B|nr:uncharacterized protein LOC121674049 [Corvus kubaryi]XP_041903927.1 uncharacterized protein LOC121674049 [Corvus kubaryi]XP_041903928.1 uncharacterized protein LOC121674049 [Corvus kubaryi]